MSIDMYLRKSEDQSSKVEKTSKDLTDKYDELQNAISQFVNESELKGKAYDSGKQFFSTVIQPLTDSIKTLGDLTEQACNTFVDKYKSEVDTQSLKESELEEDIRELQQQIDELNSISESTPPGNSLLIAAHHRMVESLENQKRDLEDKLNKLRLFNNESANLFKEVESFKQTVQQGIEQARTSWDSGTQTFNIPSTKELEWTKVVQQKAIEVQVYKILQKLKEGKTINSNEKNKLVAYLVNTQADSLDKNIKLDVNKIVADISKNLLNSGITELIEKYGENRSKNPELSLDGKRLDEFGKIIIKGAEYVKKVAPIADIVSRTYDDIKNENKTIGEAFAHNILVTGTGVLVEDGIADILSTSTLGLSVVAGASMGTVASITVEKAYQNNTKGLRTGTNWVGQNILDPIFNKGNSIVKDYWEERKFRFEVSKLLLIFGYYFIKNKTEQLIVFSFLVNKKVGESLQNLPNPVNSMRGW